VLNAACLLREEVGREADCVRDPVPDLVDAVPGALALQQDGHNEGGGGGLRQSTPPSHPAQTK